MLPSLQEGLRQWVMAWARRRQGLDPSPVRLERRRVYILPSRQGLLYAAIVFTMLLGSLNYANSMGFVLTFFLAALGFIAMHHTHRNLEGLELALGRAEPVFAGQSARFIVHAANPARAPRSGITLDYQRAPRDHADLAPLARKPMVFEVTTEKRGWLRPGRFGVHTTWPFGLFRAWVWIEMDARCLVYPHPAEHAPSPPVSAAETGSTALRNEGQDDFSGLRRYRPGDAPRHVAWKASARLHDRLLVKEFHGGGMDARWLDFDAVPASSTEEKLSMLTRWIVDAQARGERYGLRLPNRNIGMDCSDEHFHRCLKELALFDQGAAR